jgi:hypothetical protein
MRFAFRELDDEVRHWMAREIQDAIQLGTLHYSRRLNETGREAWPRLLLQAAEGYDEHWLAYELESLQLLKRVELRSRPLGGYSTAHVPHTAAETLADAEFNRYYMCAVCRKALANGQSVVVYRAKHRDQPRPESQSLIGQTLDPASLILELRDKQSTDTHPLLLPNSGLSIHTAGLQETQGVGAGQNQSGEAG